VIRRWRKRRQDKASGVEEQRKIKEQYRQAFGEEYAARYGRPIGWAMFFSAIEKIGFPTALIIMLVLRMWDALLVTIIAEIVVSLIVLVVIARGERFGMFCKGLLVTPIRYAMVIADTFTLLRFGSDIWITGNRKWRK
jgi:hypothetical protein